jgi:hypothetical protein
VMTYDHAIIPKIKEINTKAKIGIIDPRNYEVAKNANLCDFLIIDSVEMEDYWSFLKKPMLRYAEYPDIPTIKKEHAQSDLLKIGYHGNQIHLDCMQDTVTPALSSLSKKYNIELLVMHSGPSPTGDESWIPKGVKVKHIPWSMNAYITELAHADIGLVPNNIIHDSTEKSLNSLNRKYNYSADDYSIRFKMPSNPGRFIVFGKLGIPVVADFYPSALQYLNEDHKTGMVACNAGGWERCLDKLMSSAQLRQEMGENLQNIVESNFNFDYQNLKFLNFISSL